MKAGVTGKADTSARRDRPQLPLAKPRHTAPSKKRQLASPRAKEVRPEQVIPFDDEEDFKEF